jgi:hypothetical protein
MKDSKKNTNTSRQARNDEDRFIVSEEFARMQKRLTGKTRNGRPVQKRIK